MIYGSLREFRSQTKAAFDLAVVNPIYINRNGVIYMLEVLGDIDEFEPVIDPETGDEVLMKKEQPSGREV